MPPYYYVYTGRPAGLPPCYAACQKLLMVRYFNEATTWHEITQSTANVQLLHKQSKFPTVVARAHCSDRHPASQRSSGSVWQRHSIGWQLHTGQLQQLGLRQMDNFSLLQTQRNGSKI